MSSEHENMQVAIRVRPLSEIELNAGYQNIIKKIGDEPQILVGATRNSAYLFTFNYVFTETDSQEIVYTTSVHHMIPKLFEGYNVTILAYGQTGSGKTHTMNTNYNPNESMGIIPRAVLEIFENVANMKIKSDITIKCSFIELYNEHLFDLLSNSTNRHDCIVDIREDAAKGIIIPGLTEIIVDSIDEVMTCLVKGASGRAVGATAMNATSSRSHAIFTITIQVMRKGKAEVKTSSRFHLVDLAGSERSKKTKATGDRLKEGIKINQGLFALGKCITALDRLNANNFVPYRESKLTRLLQDSLGGNSVTLLIACVSPADFNMDETLNTLNYANRAKNIKNKPIINHDPDAMELENWVKKAQALRLEILNRETKSHLSIDNEGNISVEQLAVIAKLKTELSEANQQNIDLHTQFRIAMSSLLQLEIKDDLIDKTYNQLIEIVNEMNETINCRSIQEICETYDELALTNFHKVQTIAEDMKLLLEHVVSDVPILNDNIDNQNINMSDSCGIYEDSDEMDLERFHQKQLGFTNEIHEINQQIAFKEELQQQLLGHLPSFLADNVNMHGKIVELINKIKNLEIERNEIERQLEKTNAESNDERLDKIGALERKIETLVKKHRQQQKLLEVREADATRTKQLQNDIKELKAARVRIMREIKKCSNQHKKWTINKNKEINKIRGLERKKKCEISRLNISDIRQQTVLKRRIAQAFAGIKNLESKIEKKRTAQHSRHRRPNLVKTCDIKNELEVILTIAETENSLDQIKQNREHIISEIELLKQEIPLRSQEITEAEKNLQELTKQLATYHKTIISAKKDDKIKRLLDSTGSIEDEREAFNCLFDEILYLTKESSEKDSECNMIMKSMEAANNRILLLETKQQNIKQHYSVDLNMIERLNEEKLGQLMREIQFGGQKVSNQNTSAHKKLVTDAQKTKRQYLQMLSDLESENHQLLNELDHLCEQKQQNDLQVSNLDDDYQDNIAVNMISEIIDDEVHKLDTKLERVTTRSQINKTNETNITLDKRVIQCNCTKKCSTRRCKCRKNNFRCNDKCKCKNVCSNIGREELLNCNSSTGKNLNTAFVWDGHTPDRDDLMVNNFDVTTPRYPYEKKARIPFYNLE